LLGVAALLPLVVRDAFVLDSLILILMWGALSAAWNVAGGYAGQVSLGHAAFFGIGAYSAALMTARFHQGPWLGLLLGVVLSIAAGGVIGYLSNRLRGPYFALSTIAFSQVLLIVASRWRGFTAGSEGIPVPFRPGLWTLGLGHVAWVYVALVVALVYYGVQVWLETSRIGYQLAGVREDEDAAEALGIASRRLKIRAVTLSAAMTAVGGTFWAQYVGFVDPFYVFSIDLSIRFALNTIIGAKGTAKTTLFNVIAGYYRPDGGRVVFDGRDVGGRPPHVICRLGLTRTFQLVKPFGNLSVVDNVMIGALTRLRRVSAARLE